MNSVRQISLYFILKVAGNSAKREMGEGGVENVLGGVFFRYIIFHGRKSFGFLPTALEFAPGFEKIGAIRLEKKEILTFPERILPRVRNSPRRPRNSVREDIDPSTGPLNRGPKKGINAREGVRLGEKKNSIHK